MEYNNYLLGELIEQYDEINSNEEFKSIDDLQGINNNKCFQGCKSNKNDIDLLRYRICRNGMFSYNRATSRNGEKISIAYRTGKDCLVSPSYYCFRIKDEDILCPDYLDIWFKRPVFDRYARFNSWGSATEFFSFADFCATRISIPPIEEQRKIVRDYQIISDRIDLLRKINSNLQSVIDVNFERFYTESCDIETVLSSVCALTSSKRVFAEDYVSEGVPFYRGGEISLKKSGEPIEDPLFISREHYNSIKETYGIPAEGDILITAVGTIGNSYLVENEEFYFKDGNIIWLKDFVVPEFRFFVYDFLQSNMFRTTLNSLYIGSTQIALTIVGLSGMKINIPEVPALQEYASRSAVFRKEIQRNQKELLELHNLRKLLLAKGA